MKYSCERRPELYTQFKPEFDLLDKFDILVSKIYDNSKDISFSETDAMKNIVWFLTGKATKSYYAAKMLCEQGYGTDALIIERTLVELLISVKYILEEDSEERAKKFASYEWVLKYQNIHYDRISLFSFKILPQDEMDRRDAKIREEYENTCNVYPTFKKWGLPWTGEKTHITAKRLGLETYYQIVYSMASEFIHPTPSSARHYLEQVAENHKSIKIGPSPDFIEEALATLMVLMLDIVVVVNDVFELGKNDKISEFQSQFQGRADIKKKQREELKAEPNAV